MSRNKGMSDREKAYWFQLHTWNPNNYSISKADGARSFSRPHLGEKSDNRLLVDSMAAYSAICFHSSKSSETHLIRTRTNKRK